MNATIQQFDSLSDVSEGCPSELDRRMPFAAVNGLSRQISNDELCASIETMRRFFNSRGVLFLARLGDQIIGMATLMPVPDIDDLYGEVENVVVDKEYRGHGYSRLLMAAVIARARREKMSMLKLTSQPFRVEANGLYPSMGFKKRETNVYRLDLRGA